MNGKKYVLIIKLWHIFYIGQLLIHTSNPKCTQKSTLCIDHNNATISFESLFSNVRLRCRFFGVEELVDMYEKILNEVLLTLGTNRFIFHVQ